MTAADRSGSRAPHQLHVPFEPTNRPGATDASGQAEANARADTAPETLAAVDPVPADEAGAHTGEIAALGSLHGWTPRRLATLFSHHHPVEAVAVVSGEASPHPMVAPLLEPDRVDKWRSALVDTPPAEWAESCRAMGIRAAALTERCFPPALAFDPAVPGAIFWRGDPGVLASRRVAIVGTRNATRAGRETAAQLGFELASNRVVVVSGLAKGIDASAHQGALRANGAPVAGVVGNGLDRAYPRANAQLWADVADAGVVLSEWPPGTLPDGFRFPQRNRLIAALAEVVIVVESRETGGSLITAIEAVSRDVRVMAVPGSLQNRAALGTNRLISDGAEPLTCCDDVLVALGLDTRRAAGRRFDPRPAARGFEAAVLERCRRDPATLDELTGGLGRPVGETAMAVARLERSGWLRESNGWFEAVNAWVDLP